MQLSVCTQYTVQAVYSGHRVYKCTGRPHRLRCDQSQSRPVRRQTPECELTLTPSLESGETLDPGHLIVGDP